MSGLGGLMGLGGGASGSGFAAPTTNTPQLNQSYQNTQNSLQQQQSFVNALNQQNGLGNQANVFGQLQGVANGTGPNPAKAQLNQATAANTANQAALMAGQRGSNANAGLIARQAAMQGAANQQNAAGQAATLQAQQSLGAINSMGNIANTQVAQQQAGLTGLGQQGLQQQANLIGGQNNVNTANAGLAGDSQDNQGNMFGNLTGAFGSALGSMTGSGSSGGSSPIPGLTDTALPASSTSGTVLGGDTVPIASDTVDLAEAQGGMIPKMATGGIATPAIDPVQSGSVAPITTQGPSSNVGKLFNDQSQGGSSPTKSSGGGNPLGAITGALGQATKMSGAAIGNLYHGAQNASNWVSEEGSNAGQGITSNLGNLGSSLSNDLGTAGSGAGASSASSYLMYAAEGGAVPALVSPGEQYLPPKAVKQVIKGKNPLKTGERIPGKPKHPGNDYRNDTVKKTLKSGGIVIPNEVMQSKNPHFAAMKFVHATIAKNRHGKK